jgi:hypothetical protein
MDFYVNNMMNLKYILIIYIFNNIGPPFYVSHRGLQNLETGLLPCPAPPGNLSARWLGLLYLSSIKESRRPPAGREAAPGPCPRPNTATMSYDLAGSFYA